MEAIPSLSLSRDFVVMNESISIYVDESGNFGDVRDASRYCLVTLVFRDDAFVDTEVYREYQEGISRLGMDPDAMMFHAGPVIRQEEQFSAMSRNLRGKIFYQMLSYIRKSNLRYITFVADSKFVASEDQIVSNLKNALKSFLAQHPDLLARYGTASVYYDAGQKGVMRILEGLQEVCGSVVTFVQGVRQQQHHLLQVADFICMIKLIERRLADGIPFNSSEMRFFGSSRDFKRNVLRKVLPKELV